MTKIKMKVLGILCAMIHVDLIFIRHSLKILLKFKQLILKPNKPTAFISGSPL